MSDNMPNLGDDSSQFNPMTNDVAFSRMKSDLRQSSAVNNDNNHQGSHPDPPANQMDGVNTFQSFPFDSSQLTRKKEDLFGNQGEGDSFDTCSSVSSIPDSNQGDIHKTPQETGYRQRDSFLPTEQNITPTVRSLDHEFSVAQSTNTDNFNGLNASNRESAYTSGSSTQYSDVPLAACITSFGRPSVPGRFSTFSPSTPAIHQEDLQTSSSSSYSPVSISNVCTMRTQPQTQRLSSLSQHEISDSLNDDSFLFAPSESYDPLFFTTKEDRLLHRLDAFYSAKRHSLHHLQQLNDSLANSFLIKRYFKKTHLLPTYSRCRLLSIQSDTVFCIQYLLRSLLQQNSYVFYRFYDDLCHHFYTYKQFKQLYYIPLTPISAKAIYSTTHFSMISDPQLLSTRAIFTSSPSILQASVKHLSSACYLICLISANYLSGFNQTTFSNKFDWSTLDDYIDNNDQRKCISNVLDGLPN